MMVRWLLLLVTAAVAACASGRAGDGPNGGPNGGQHDAPPGSTRDSATTSPDAKPGPKLDAAMMIDAPGGGGGGGLDPDLEIPASGGQFCDEPGRGSPECPAGEVCRFYTSTEGRCEGCDPATCGNLGASCSATDQCDILFECYKGQCTNFCTLGTTECGPQDDCIDIGHATRGVCRV